MFNPNHTPQRHSSHYVAATSHDSRHLSRHHTAYYSQGYQQYYGPPAGADPQLWQWFANVDRDRSGSISVSELQSALVNGMYVLHHIVVKVIYFPCRGLVA